ncbi:MAG TPA: ATP-binding protein [Bacteroidia bacterium]|nr:ATP-binding protein [Bacteroidia bacterium]
MDKVAEKDKRLRQILDQVMMLTKTDHPAKDDVSINGDDLNIILEKLNLLGKQLSEEEARRKNGEKRMEALLEILMQYTVQDFSNKVKLSAEGDEIDAIAAGFNILGEELSYSLTREKENLLELEIRNGKLLESEERFRLMVQNIKDYAIFFVDPLGYVQSWNKGAQNLQGYAAEEIIGKHLSVFYTESDIEKGVPENNLKIALKNGHYETQGIRIRKNRSSFWAEVLYTPLYDGEGKLKGFSKIERDITELRNARLQLESKTRELERSNADLEQFAYVASHDLQEPLRTVSSYVQLLASRYGDKLDKDAHDFIGFAVDGSKRMKALISSLLDYSRVNNIKPFTLIDTSSLVNEILTDMKDQVNETGTVVGYNDLPKIYGDPLLIGQLFQNLIGNSIKFKGERKPEIKITSVRKNGYYEFCVEDNGIGLNKEYSEKIFIIFQRLNHRDKYPGTGIGLSICKKIVERHGGKIWVDSVPGKGSKFYFTIKT